MTHLSFELDAKSACVAAPDLGADARLGLRGRRLLWRGVEQRSQRQRATTITGDYLEGK